MNLQYIVNLGAFFFRKARANQAESGTYQAARNLRKQGVPLSIALDVLARRPLRYPAVHVTKLFHDSIPRGVIVAGSCTAGHPDFDFTARA